MRRGGKQLREVTQSIGADRLVLERRQEPLIDSLAGIHIEMVHPEVNHDFVKLTLTVSRSPELFAAKLHTDSARPGGFHRWAHVRPGLRGTIVRAGSGGRRRFHPLLPFG